MDAERLTHLEMISRFTHGQCHTLAAIMSERGHGPVCVLYCDGSPVHAVVDLGEGMYGDVRGVHSEADLQQQWDMDEVKPWIYSGDIRAATQAYYSSFGTRRCAFAAAEAIADDVAAVWSQVPAS